MTNLDVKAVVASIITLDYGWGIIIASQDISDALKLKISS